MEDIDILEYIMRLSRAVRRRRSGSKERGQITKSGFRLLLALEKEEFLRASELARLLDIRPASLTEQLVRLEEKDLIKREKDPNDLRAINISISPKAAKMLEEGRLKRNKQREELKRVLDIKEREQFARIAEKLINFFEAGESFAQDTKLSEKELGRLDER